MSRNHKEVPKHTLIGTTEKSVVSGTRSVKERKARKARW